MNVDVSSWNISEWMSNVEKKILRNDDKKHSVNN